MTTDDDRDDQDLEADDPVMRSMRSVWLTMRDEDPPSGGLATLMAAAREKAAQMQPQESWWRRSFALLVRPPVLAAATVVVLIGGALVINSRSKDLEVPAVQSGPVDEKRADHAAQPEKQQVPEEPKLESETATVRNDEGAGSSAATVVTDPPASSKPPRSAPRPPVVRGSATQTVKPGGGEVVGDNSRDVTGRVVVPDVDKPKTVPAQERTPEPGGLLIAGEDDPSVTDAVKETPARDVPSRRVEPVPPPKNVQDTETVQVTGSSTPRGRPQSELVDQLVKQTEVAASRKDCPAVRATAARIKKLDSNVYKSRVATQAAIAKCIK